jgi:autotransporter-associated beta strand protein
LALKNNAATPVGITLSVGWNGSDTAYSGVLSGNSSVQGWLIKVGGGTLTLSGANTYNGTTIVGGGTLNLANGSALQNSTLLLNDGALAFDQSAGTTSFTIGGLSGSRNLALQNNASAAVNLTVGSNGANSIYSGVLSGGGSLTKAGNGLFTLTGTNTYVGQTTISAGTLRISSNGNLGAVATGSQLNLNGGTLNATSSFALDNNGANSRNVNVSAASAISVDPGQTLTVSGNVSGAGSLTNSGLGTLALSGTVSNPSLVNSGPGTLVLSGNANATNLGATINSGTVVLDYTKYNNSKLSGAVTLGGGNVTINPNASASTTESFASTTLNGVATVTVNQNGSQAATLKLGAITRNTGGAMNIVTGGANAIATTTTGTAGTMLGGWATINGADWAVSGGSASSAITALNSGSYTAMTADPASDSNKALLSGSLTLTGAQTHNSLKLASSGSGAQTLDLGANQLSIAGPAAAPSGLLITGTDAYTISNGNLTIGTGASVDLVVHQFDTGGATISATIGDNGSAALSLVKAGSETLTLTGNNTYTGTTTIGAGTLQIGNGGTTGTLGSGNIIDNGSLVFNRSDTALSVGKLISGTGSVTMAGSGTVTLSTANTYSGATFANAGTLALTHTNAAQSSTLTMNGGAVQFGTGNTAYNLGGLSGTGNLAIQNTSGGQVNLSVGLNNTNTIYSGSLSGSTGVLYKKGSGTLTLTGNSSFGASTALNTSVDAGTLIVNGSITTPGWAYVNSGGTIGGNGTISSSIYVWAGGTLSPGAGVGVGKLNTGSLYLGGTLMEDIASLLSFDQVNVTGTVSLTGTTTTPSHSTLSLSLGTYVPSNGSLFFLVVNDGTDAVNGTFANLPTDGSTFSLGGQQWQISYAANYTGNSLTNSFSGGNDIALMAVPEPGVAMALIGGATMLLGLRRRRQ